MYNNKVLTNNTNNNRRAAWARGFIPLFAMLAMGLALAASPAAAAPVAYVANFLSGTVSVIDTATNTVVTGTRPDSAVIGGPTAVAVTPDGKHAYVAISNANSVVIDTATNKVVATIPVGNGCYGVAITPDGKHAYVANLFSNNVSVIATVSNTVVATVAVGSQPFGVAVTPNGKHAYVTNQNSNNVSVIATASNTVVATVAVGSGPIAVAVTPDGKHAYVTIPGNVSVIDTASNTVVATIPVGNSPEGVAVTPDGKHAYVTNFFFPNNVSVIATASNTVVATVQVGSGSVAVGIVPPPAGVPFLAFNATLGIHFGGAPNEDSFNLHSPFTLSSTAPGLHPHRDPVTLQVGTFSITMPAGSFREQPDGSFAFAGVISGVSLKAQIYHTGTVQYAFHAKARGASLTGTKNMVYVTLIIGGDSGATSATAAVSGKPSVVARISP
jgi:YVTN family beta-propeller protein